MAATEPLPAVTPEQIVEREATTKVRVGFASLAAAVAVVIAGVLPQSILADFPRVYALDSLRDAAGQSIGRDGLRTAQILFLDHHSAGLLIVSVCQAIALALMGVLLVFLFDATVRRGGTPPRMTRPLAIFGAVAGAICAVVVQVGLTINASDFASSSDHGTKAAHDALGGGVLTLFGFIGLIASLAFAAAFVMIVIGAMRVGLLTRFLGILGAIVGVLVLIGRSGSPTFTVQAFWLIMLGVLLFGRWPGAGIPAAWTEGEARPWPTQQEIREAKDRARGKGDYAPGKQEAPAAATANGTASPASAARKKRKRR